MHRRGCVVSRTLVRTVRELVGTLERLAMNASPAHQALAHISARSVVVPGAIQEPSRAVHSRRS
jgi:hypothetical protein